MPFQNPLLPDCFLTWTEPPDDSGDELYHIVSWRRSLTLKGHSFREFGREVVPLLDGRTPFDRIVAEVADLFERKDLENALDMLGGQGIVVEAEPAEAALPERLHTQLAWLSETAPDGRAAQRRLSEASVVLFGAAGPGASLARSLAAAGIGRLAIVDPGVVLASDPYFSALFRSTDIGRPRAEALVEALAALAPDCELTAETTRPADIAAIGKLIADATYVACCLDSGELNLALKLNRACRERGARWIAGGMEGLDLVVGPGFSGEAGAPCYMCWRMREVACAANPQSRFAEERHLDRMHRDLSGRRENMAFSADIVGGLMAAEMLSVLTGAGQPTLDGRLLVIELPGLRQEKHTVLRKPGCPVCGQPAGQPS